MGGAASTRGSRQSLRSSISARDTSTTEVNARGDSQDIPETLREEKTDTNVCNNSFQLSEPSNSNRQCLNKSLGRDKDRRSSSKVQETRILQGIQSPKTSKTKAISNVDKYQNTARESSDIQRKGRSPSSNQQLEDDQSPKDVMISYSHADRKMMLKVRETLESNGISVWVDISGLRAGVDFLGKIGQAIIDAKSFITLLSTNSIKSKYCQDELALAYVSNKAVFPLNLQSQEYLTPLMTTGERLQLAGLNWISMTDSNQEEDNLQELVRLIKEEIIDRETLLRPAETDDPPARPHTARQRLNKRRRQNVQHDKTLKVMPRTYWENHYHNQDQVSWEKFVQDFLSAYRTALSKMYSEEDQNWLVGILKREMEVQDDQLEFEMFLEFCIIDGEEQPFWQRVQDQARESSAMMEVFDMTSDVRVTAIENLGKFRSSAVIDALRDLLTDTNANVRAVAAVSLARTNADDTLTVDHIMKCLKDNDRLVREAGCLALGHLKAKKAVKKILHMWRNDVISNVREAATVALQQIGGQEVEKEMHLTKVLADEIRQLTR